MPHTYSDGKNIYSVDMMFAYLDLFKHEIVYIDVHEYLDSLENPGWGNNSSNIFYSAIDVLNNKEQYPEELKRIEKADLDYPIIITDNCTKKNIVDGIHRLTKAYILKKKQIMAYIFNDDLMKKFLIDDNKDYDKTDNMGYEIISLFYKNFCK